MDLLEYQAKRLFRQIGIPVLPSETIANPRELKQLQIPYPVVLKSQVKAGGRGKAGGVKFVTNTIDAIAAARNIFNLSILGEYPEVILAEARYAAQKELFLAIVLDYKLQCPVIFGSISGGMDIKPLMDNLQQVTIDAEFSPFMARRLASKMGLSGRLLLAVSKIVEKMYQLFLTKDLDLIEINPLGVDAEENLMALDGKIIVNDAALARHLELFSLTGIDKSKAIDNYSNSPSQSNSVAGETVQTTQIRWLDWENIRGKIALLTNDEYLNLLCWDLLVRQKEKPACGIVVDDVPTQEQLQEIIDRLQSMKGIKVVSIDFWGSEEANMAIAKAFFELPEIADLSSEAGMAKNRSESFALKFVIRLATQNIEFYQQEFCHEAIFWTNNLEEAISKTIDFSKAK